MISAATVNLVERTRAYLTVYDEASLRRYLRRHWSIRNLIGLLSNPDSDITKVAATCLGISRAPDAVPALTGALSHEDAVVCSMAEFALWTIWFGQAGPAAESRLRRVARLDFDPAIAVLDGLISAHPGWVEPFNQRAIVNYRNHCFISAIDDYKETLSINERHFAALAGLGHAYAQLGLYSDAADCYQNALSIHPRIAGIRQALRTVRQLIRQAQAVD